jgi:hypothetical protein
MERDNAIFERALSGDLSLPANGRFVARAVVRHRAPASGAGAFTASALCLLFNEHYHDQMLAPDIQ